MGAPEGVGGVIQSNQAGIQGMIVGQGHRCDPDLTQSGQPLIVPAQPRVGHGAPRQTWAHRRFQIHDACVCALQGSAQRGQNRRPTGFPCSRLNSSGQGHIGLAWVMSILDLVTSAGSIPCAAVTSFTNFSVSARTLQNGFRKFTL